MDIYIGWKRVPGTLQENMVPSVESNNISTLRKIVLSINHVNVLFIKYIFCQFLSLTKFIFESILTLHYSIKASIKIPFKFSYKESTLLKAGFSLKGL